MQVSDQVYAQTSVRRSQPGVFEVDKIRLPCPEPHHDSWVFHSIAQSYYWHHAVMALLMSETVLNFSCVFSTVQHSEYYACSQSKEYVYFKLSEK